MEVIPAIDLLDGKAVRLMKGRYEDVTVYHDNPPVLAAGWSGKVKRLHVVDLEGARAGKAVQHDLVIRLVKAFGSAPMNSSASAAMAASTTCWRVTSAKP